jgi:hypothetical protein
VVVGAAARAGAGTEEVVVAGRAVVVVDGGFFVVVVVGRGRVVEVVGRVWISRASSLREMAAGAGVWGAGTLAAAGTAPPAESTRIAVDESPWGFRRPTNPPTRVTRHSRATYSVRVFPVVGVSRFLACRPPTSRPGRMNPGNGETLGNEFQACKFSRPNRAAVLAHVAASTCSAGTPLTAATAAPTRGRNAGPLGAPR